MVEQHDSQPDKEQAAQKPEAAQTRVWQSHELLGTSNEARIVHGKEVYRLLLTRNQKLILIK